jgi:WD40 repeat protein
MWVGKFSDRTAQVTAVVFAPDGRTIYTGDSAGWVRAWDVASHEHRKLCQRPRPWGGGSRGVHSLWPTPDGKRLLVDSDRSLLDALSPEAPVVLTAPEDSGGNWRYLLPDGRRVISCEDQWTVGLWDLETGKRLGVPGELGKARDITYHSLLPDGVTLLTYCTEGDELPLWDFNTGKHLGSLTPTAFGINPCALAKDGGTFVVGHTGQLWVYDVPSRGLRHKLKARSNVSELAFHPGGRLVASASTDDYLITLWDATAGKKLTQFDWNSGYPGALAFSPDGLTCAVAGKSLVVFDIDL